MKKNEAMLILGGAGWWGQPWAGCVCGGGVVAKIQTILKIFSFTAVLRYSGWPQSTR